jgi:TRAP-type C4-dicarboxylate transport system permease small subunit
MNVLTRIDKWLFCLEKTIVSACMIIMAAILLTAVIFRHLNIVMVGGEEIARFTMVWLTFWGMALCARKGNHIIMSAVLDKIRLQKRKILVTAICLISGCFCLILSGYAAQLTYSVFHRGQVTPALRLPIWYMYVSTPLGFFLTGIYYVGAFLKNLTGKEIYFGLEQPQ